MENEASSSGNNNALFFPCKVGRFTLTHRVVLAPVTRCRAINNIPQEAHVTYYSQRASKGGFLITEGVAISQQAIGFPHAPGIYTAEQVQAWKPVVDAVHRKGGIIFCQLWHVGRASHECYQPNQGKPVSSTSSRIPAECRIRMPDGSYGPFTPPRALSIEEIQTIILQYTIAARNARLAGFDGVEIHAGHGYLLDQFFKDGINDRSDAYGGSLANRCRLALQVLFAIVREIGADRTAIRISPIIDHLGATDSNPIDLGLYLVNQLNAFKLAYLHVTEPRYTAKGIVSNTINCQFIRDAYKGLLMCSGGHTRNSGIEVVRSGYADLVSYGRLFISNPDLPLRFALNAPLNAYDRSTFYTQDPIIGYTDYPFLPLLTKPSSPRFKQHESSAENILFTSRL